MSNGSSVVIVSDDGSIKFVQPPDLRKFLLDQHNVSHHGQLKNAPNVWAHYSRFGKLNIFAKNAVPSLFVVTDIRGPVILTRLRSTPDGNAIYEPLTPGDMGKIFK